MFVLLQVDALIAKSIVRKPAISILFKRTTRRQSSQHVELRLLVGSSQIAINLVK